MLMHKLRTRMSRGDKGNEAVGLIFLFPFLAFIAFILIETGFNMHYRSLVDNITQDTVRSISQDGGLYWGRTTYPQYNSAGDQYATGTTWTQVGEDRLLELCGAAPGSNTSRCEKPPTMTCTVQDGQDFPPFGVGVAPAVNTPVSCTATFFYNPVSPLTQNPVTSVGFSNVLTAPFVITINGLTVTGLEG